MAAASEKLGRRDYLLLALLSIILFGYSVISARPLTVHEARLPQTARVMRATGQWLFPQSGARPWLERPPLPHWIVNSVMAVAGHHDQVLTERFPSALMGTLVVLLTAWTAAGLFGRTTALVSGLVLATSWQLYIYASLAEDDIYLAAAVAACMALFVRAEFVDQRIAEDRRANPFSTRPLVLLAFFTLLGLSNVIKSPLLGMLAVLPAVGCYLLWRCDARRILRYAWVWGWLGCLAIGAAWPLAAYYAYPDVMDNWRYDYLGRMSGHYSKINQPVWYYGPAILVALMPWTPFAIFGLVLTRAAAWRNRESAERLLWCWAIAPLVVLSVPQGKHHHYLVPVMAPWAILGAIGLMRVSEAVAKKYPRFNPRWAMGMAVVLLCVSYSLGQSFAAPATDRTIQDTKFLRQATALVSSDKPLFINADEDESLDFFRLQYYSRDDTRLLQNLTYLREEGIAEPVVYVIARTWDQDKLETMGSTRILLQSEKSHGDGTPGGRFALFELCFDANLQRYPAPPRPTCLQAMGRLPGPFCGPPWRAGSH
jgi:4-amino-4-deoxy-L-arabinose transferase-like glycosyltransferase